MVYVLSKARIDNVGNQEVLYSPYPPRRLAYFSKLEDAESEFARLIAYLCKERTVSDRPLSLFAPPNVDYIYSIYKVPEEFINISLMFNPGDTRIKRIISLNTESDDFCNRYISGKEVNKKVIRTKIITTLNKLGLPEDFIKVKIFPLLN